MSKFKVGDRVIVYDSRLLNGRSVGIIKYEKNSIGQWSIEGVKRMDGYTAIVASDQQLRKIKRKEKSIEITRSKLIKAWNSSMDLNDFLNYLNV